MTTAAEAADVMSTMMTTTTAINFIIKTNIIFLEQSFTALFTGVWRYVHSF
jgi:hypothetical protein